MDDARRRSLATQAAVGLASFLTPFVYGALSVAMPTIGRQFAFTPSQMATVMMVHLLLSTSCNLPFGRLSDRVGRKRIFMAGSFTFAASSLLAACSNTTWLLVGARALQGIGDAMTFGVSAAILVSAVPPERLGRAMGANIAFVYAGLALGPLAGGALTAHVSWRVIFLLSATAGAAALMLIRRGFEEAPAEVPAQLDLPGMALYLPALATLLLGASLQPSWTGLGLVAVSLPLFRALYRTESRVARPLLDIAFLRDNPGFDMANLASTLGYAAGFSTSFLASLLLQSVMGRTAEAAGYVLLAQPLVMALASPLAGMLSDRFHPGKVGAAGLGVLCLGMFALAGVGADAQLSRAAWLLGLSGLGFALFVSPNIHAVMRGSDGPHMGMASGLLATMRGLGMCLSLSMTGIVLALWPGQAEAARAGAEIMPALRACFVLAGLTGIAAAAASWRSAD